MTNIELDFSALAHPLADQLKEQNLKTTDENRLEVFQLDADAITRMYIRGYMPESQTTKARKRLMKFIANLPMTKIE